MKNKTHKVLALTCALIILLVLGYFQRTDAEYIRTETVRFQDLSHAQQVWLGALEWCESRGNKGAINPKDNDGTPSYGAFQFKPSTLYYYATMYKIPLTWDRDTDTVGSIATTLDYGAQRATIEAMVLDRKNINWNQQFPACVKKLGAPPAGDVQ